jgi:hypothetical protein
LTIEQYAQNWAARSEYLRRLSEMQQQAAQYVEGQQFSQSYPSDDVNAWQKNALAYNQQLAANRAELDKQLAAIAALRKQLDDLDATDALIAKEYGLTAEELASMMTDDLRAESRWAQQEAVEGSLWLANAIVGYNERATAQAQSYLKTLQTIREERKVVDSLWGTNTEGSRKLDELDAVLAALEKATVGDNSILEGIYQSAVSSERDTIELVRKIQAYQGNAYGDPVQLALERLNVWRLKSILSGNPPPGVPTDRWLDIVAMQASSAVEAKSASEQAIKEAKEHSAWMRWIKNRGGFEGDPDDDDNSDPNPFIPV